MNNSNSPQQTRIVATDQVEEACHDRPPVDAREPEIVLRVVSEYSGQKQPLTDSQSFQGGLNVVPKVESVLILAGIQGVLVVYLPTKLDWRELNWAAEDEEMIEDHFKDVRRKLEQRRVRLHNVVRKVQ